MKNLFCLLLLALSISINAQVAINTDGSAPNSSSMLDVKSITSGVLIPRMTSDQRTAIISPANGLLVYQTDDVIGIYYFNNDVWQCIREIDGSETKVTSGANVTVAGTGTTANPYIINASGGSSGHYVGEPFGGGMIFWVDSTGQHGYIVSLINLCSSCQWGTYYFTGAVSTWDGEANSVLNNCCAAQVCLDYTNSALYGTGTYSDWYLPAIDQLSTIYHNRLILNKNLESITGATILGNSSYWSSTDFNNNNALAFGFLVANASPDDKENIYWVRAVRSF